MDTSDQDSSAKQNDSLKAATESLVPLLYRESPVARGWCCSQIEVDKFSFIWRIDNFTFWRETSAEKYLESSIFSAGSTEKLEWKLRLNPKCVVYGNYFVSLFLVLVSGYESGVLSKFQFFILKDDGDKTSENCSEMFEVFRRGDARGYSEFIRRSALLNEVNGLLPDNNLTILCEGSFALDRVHVSSPSRQLQAQIAECKISQDLGSLFENQKFADVTLSVGGKDLLVHKAILAARSPVFAAMFEHEMKESSENRVVIEDVTYEAVEGMIAYIYTGRSPNIEDTAEDILALADKYNLDGLKAMCETIWCSSITVENSANLLILAEMYSAQQLEAQVGHFVSIRAKDVMRTSAWNDMAAKYPQLIVKAFETLALR